LAAGLTEAGIDPAQAPALGQEMAEYAQRQRVEENNQARLAELGLPRITLPDLNPPVEVGELKDLAARFEQDGE
jgi:hypothetical protein